MTKWSNHNVRHCNQTTLKDFANIKASNWIADEYTIEKLWPYYFWKYVLMGSDAILGFSETILSCPSSFVFPLLIIIHQSGLTSLSTSITDDPVFFAMFGTVGVYTVMYSTLHAGVRPQSITSTSS